MDEITALRLEVIRLNKIIDLLADQIIDLKARRGISEKEYPSSQKGTTITENGNTSSYIEHTLPEKGITLCALGTTLPENGTTLYTLEHTFPEKGYSFYYSGTTLSEKVNDKINQGSIIPNQENEYRNVGSIIPKQENAYLNQGSIISKQENASTGTDYQEKRTVSTYIDMGNGNAQRLAISLAKYFYVSAKREMLYRLALELIFMHNNGIATRTELLRISGLSKPGFAKHIPKVRRLNFVFSPSWQKFSLTQKSKDLINQVLGVPQQST